MRDGLSAPPRPRCKASHNLRQRRNGPSGANAVIDGRQEEVSMPRDDKDDKDQIRLAVGAIAGLAVVAGALAVGSSKRRSSRSGSGDAPRFSRRNGGGDLALVGRSVTIRKGRQEVFAYFRDFKNLPSFMENLDRIENKGDGHNVWVIRGPAGRTVDVETQISSEKDGEHIAWKSVAGSDIQTSGRVTFEDAPGDRGTRVGLDIAYDPPGGKVGRAFAKLFLREPEIQARHDLKRFKMLMETGEIATSARTKDERRAAKQQENG
ncbi:SRPBCC family protein [Sphingomicrobium sp. XHP0235]|uniref:SRPBCC family protein n=1 Tax=Sphingomicrobium aquimarinum TaxID=3133971 RepID=UPI0031FEB3CB